MQFLRDVLLRVLNYSRVGVTRCMHAHACRQVLTMPTVSKYGVGVALVTASLTLSNSGTRFLPPARHFQSVQRVISAVLRFTA